MAGAEPGSGPRFEQLNDGNYATWSCYCRAYLISRELWQPIATSRPEPREEQDAWDRKDALALAQIQLCVKAHLLPMVVSCKTAKEAWDMLSNTYKAQSNARRMALLHDLSMLRLKPGEAIITYVARVKAIRQELMVVDHKIEEKTVVMHMLAGLPEEYRMLRTVLENMGGEWTVEDVAGKMIQEEQRAKMAAPATGGPAAMTQALAAEIKSQRRTFTCYYCTKPGHMRRECHRRKADEKRGLYRKSIADQPRPQRGGRGDGPPRGGNPDNPWRGGPPGGGRGDGGGAAGALAFTANVAPRAAAGRSRTWVIDSGATKHMSQSMACYSEYTAAGGGRDVILADGKSVPITGTGTAAVVVGTGAAQRPMKLRDTLHVPELKGNLLSVRSVDRAGGASVFMDGHCYLLADKSAVDWNDVVTKADVVGGVNVEEQYVIDAEVQVDQAAVANLASTEVARLWHRRYHHMGLDNLKRAAKMVTGMPREIADAGRVLGSVCAPCAGGKLARAPFPRSTARTSVMDLLHTDICGPLETSLGGARYFTTLLDDASGLTVAIPIKTKGKAAGVLIPAVRKLERLSGRRARRVRHDYGGEYRSRELDDFYKAEGISAEYSAPYTPQQNGKAERVNRTLKERVRAALLDAGAEDELWAEALAAAVYVMNRSPKEGATVTPWEAFTGRRPNVSNLRVWGGRAWALKPDKHQRRLESRTAVGRFVGYTVSGNAYRVLLDDTDRVVERRDVLVEETAPPAPAAPAAVPGSLLEAGGAPHDDESAPSVEAPTTGTTSSAPSSPEITSTSSSDVETGPDSSGETQEIDDHAVVQPIAGRYPGRVRKPPGEWWRPVSDGQAGVVKADQCAAVGASKLYTVPKDSNGQELPPPTTIEEARERPDWPLWEAALRAEFGALQEMGAWQVVDLPAGAKLTGSRVVFDYKRDADGAVTRYKARFVAKGCSQKPGVDYDETSAPVPAAATVRALFAVGASRGWHMHHVDVKNAYLNARMDKPVYVAQPAGYPLGDAGKALLLQLALYGTKQAGRLWRMVWASVLSEAGATQSPADPCLYRWKHPKHGAVHFLVWVDDIIVASASEAAVAAGKQLIAARFDARDLGVVSTFLGMKIVHLKSGGRITLSSPGHVAALLEAYGMAAAKPNVTPLAAGTSLVRTGEKLLPAGNRYAELVGSLLYLATTTRPDIAFAAGVLARFMSAPEEPHWVAAKGVLRYLVGARDKGITFGSGEPLSGYTDSDFAGDRDTRRSTSGFVYMLHGGPVSWRSKRQSTVAASTAEAEYMAAAEAVKEGLWLRTLLKGMGEDPGAVQLYEDNQACLAMAGDPLGLGRAKHIDVAYHLVRDRVGTGEVVMDYLPTTEMVADGFTKALPAPAHRSFTSRLGMGAPTVV